MEPVKRIAVMGMGYVGLTLSVVLAKRGFKIFGVETNSAVAQNLRDGIPHFEEKGLKTLLSYELRRGNLEIHDALPEGDIDAFIISVGTPLVKESKEPNIDYIKNVVRDVGKRMRRGALVALRSTVPVGLSRELVIPMLEENSGLKVGEGFSYVFAPERTAEGRAIVELETNPQIIGGYDEHSVTLASDLFRRITPTTLVVSSIEASEMIKIMDNTYRDVRFAYANEMAMVCERLGLDATELVMAANIHYPRNNIPVPSPGVGGACLSKDPHILYYFAGKAGYRPELIRRARDINETVPAHIVERVARKIKDLGKDISKAKVFVVGFAFKGDPETSDLRDSTTLWFLDALKPHVKDIYGYDPVIEPGEIARLGVKAVSLEEGFKDADAVFFMNNHASYRALDPFALCALMRKPAVFFDSWRMFERGVFKDVKDVHYLGVGV